MLQTLLESVDDLARSRPHQRERDRFDPIEWRAYCQGYYMALVTTMKVLTLAAARFKSRVQTRRLETRRRKSA